MVNNKTEIENQDLEKLIDELKNQNFTLKKKIFELELEISQLKGEVSDSKKEIPDYKQKDIKSNKALEIKSGKEVKKFSKFVKKIKKKEEGMLEEPLTDSPLEEVKQLLRNDQLPILTNKPIVEGTSRRECPACGNTQHKSIYEETDKTHVIMDYPRIYGKKSKCGKCGTEWRVPVILE
ncbi:hypothetical protein LCGC14_0870350 [marine sediment metagenome]|uniref:Uncharacterized protein n=1 Tax=marine sediment metagenome TaxID=412755 RepID=A0A0F9P9Q7_9ZZZZ|nr:MAG: hypothetical protein Lokiarch_16450 [Candidatus Lokiarchaeum sp. GC14_75]